MSIDPGDGLFDARAVAAQIVAYAGTTASPQAGTERPEPVPAPAAAYATASGLLPDTLSDRGNAKLFVRLYANDYRHVPGLGWYRWDSTRWQSDEDDTVMWAAGDLAESIATTDPRGVYTAQALQQHRRRALSTSGMNSMLVQARSAPGMVLNAALLDADPYALCTPGGIVDLRTGAVRSASPSRTSTPAPPPSAPARCPRRAGCGSSPTPSARRPRARR